jgi:hypothetical protein
MVGSFWTDTKARGYSNLEFQSGYNGFDSRILGLPGKYGVSNAIVFIGENLPWQVLCSGVGENTRHSMQGSVLYASDLRRHYQAMRGGYPGRETYLMVDEEGEPALYRVLADAGGDLSFSRVQEPSTPSMSGHRREGSAQGPAAPSMIGRYRDGIGNENILSGLTLRFPSPMTGGLAFGPDGSLYSTFVNARRAFRWDAQGVLRAIYGASFLEHPGGLHGPQGIGVDAAGVVHVADIGSFAVVRFQSDGSFLQRCVQGSEGRPLGRGRQATSQGDRPGHMQERADDAQP